ncbi:deoxycytidylate deaminase [Streptobacillus canis]|uniref:deoxycytidylate deaminase n=1 Tax=Streptobacillus canis TaxID=2678686 RepID=UPI0012E10FC5|nr:dCMP deaminase family protein [Streptobacillus canis]
MKRTDFLSWDEYFMGIAFLSANRSKDPVTQVGACIVKDSKIVGIGYNGFPMGSSDDEVPWGKEGDFLNTKYAYVVHAELNAILNSNRDLKGSTIYVTHFPCNECAKSIIQTGISKVVFFSDKHKDKDSSIASRRMLNNAGIEIVKLELGIEELVIKFKD